MPEYIEKEKLLERVAGIELHVSFGRSLGKTLFAETLNFYRNAVLKAIKEAPAADVAAVKRGEWMSAYEYALKKECSDENRLAELKVDKIWKFCPYCEQQAKGEHSYCSNCGAEMHSGKMLKE